MSKFKPDKIKQGNLLGYYIEDFLEEGEIAYLVDEIVEQLETKEIEDTYSELGQKSYAPKILLKILFYGSIRGVFSSRKIARACKQDIGFMYLARMYKPDFRTISDFRKDNIERINEYLVEIIKYCKEMGMIKIGAISIDGTKIRANASSSKQMNLKEYKKWEQRIKKEIAELQQKGRATDEEEDARLGENADDIPKELKSKESRLKKIGEIKEKLEKINNKKANINLTDNDARFMRSKNGKIESNFNPQISVDQNGMIVGADVTSDAGDRRQLSPLIEQTERNLNEKIVEVYADAGYGSIENYEYLNKKEIDGYVPDQYHRQRKKEQMNDKLITTYRQKDFKYNKEKDEYICPSGQVLKYVRTSKTTVYRNRAKIYAGTNCKTCPTKMKCTKAKKRTVAVHINRNLMDAMIKKLDTDQSRAKSKIRSKTVEPVFGHIKKNLKFTQFYLRGLKKVRGEFSLICIGINLLKMWNMSNI